MATIKEQLETLSAEREDAIDKGKARQGEGFYFQTLTEGLNYDFSGRHDKAKAG